MTERTATASRSATELNNYGITQAFKRGRTQFENNETPFLTVTPPTRTESNETIITETQDDRKIRYTARKLDRLNDKEARFQSHKEFLERCITGNVIPNGLKIELEASIGNHNEQFLTKWNEKLIKFSRELTEDVIEFCGTTITETNTEINDANQQLNTIATREQQTEIITILDKNQETRKHNYKRNKDKKYYNLKYNVTNKPKPRRQNGPNEDNNDFQQFDNTNQQYNLNPNNNNENRPSYASTARRNRSKTNFFGNPNFRKNSSTNLTSNTPQTSGRQNQNTNNENETLRLRVQQLEEQVKPKNAPIMTNTINNTSNLSNGQKNTNSAQSNVPGAPLEIQDMLEYITKTMQTLNGFKTQLTQQQDTGQTHSGMS